MIKRILIIIAFLGTLLIFAGCQTVQGIGKDITWTGEAASNLIDGGGGN